MKNIVASVGLLCCIQVASAQVGIGTATPHTSAQLDITSTNKGLLMPRMSQAQRTAITSPATGLMVYQTDGTAGYYYYNGTAWAQLGGAAGWGLGGNGGTTSADFIGTTDFKPLTLKVEGVLAGFINPAYSSITSFGYSAGLNNIGNGNIAFGYSALRANTTGRYNAAVGFEALQANTIGRNNSALGAMALYNSTGDNNTAVGFSALSTTTGTNNTSLGYSALQTTTTANYNTAVGAIALVNNTTGGANTAVGYQAMPSCNTGTGNSVLGNAAGISISSGNNNTGVGIYSLWNLQTGSNNTAVGHEAGPSTSALSNTTAIGYRAAATADNTVRIGNAAVVTIGGYAAWSNLSDVRFKKDIEPEEHGLDFIMQLKPITYHMDVAGLNQHLYGKRAGALMQDATFAKAVEAKEQVRQTGFSAQQVVKAAASIGYQFSGVHIPENEQDHYTLEYSTFVVPLVKAVQEQQAIIEGQTKKLEEQAKLLDEMKKELELIKSKLR